MEQDAESRLGPHRRMLLKTGVSYAGSGLLGLMSRMLLSPLPPVVRPSC